MAKQNTEERLNHLERILKRIGGDKVKEAEIAERTAELAQERAQRQQAREEEARRQLPALREQEQDWSERYDQWLAEGLALFDEQGKLSSKIRYSYGRPRDSAPRRVQQTIKREADQRRALERARAGRNSNADKQTRADYLRAVLEEQKRAYRTLSSGKHDAANRIAETERALAEAEGKKSLRQRAEEFISPEQALGG
jgi:hypothetical protein